MNQNNRGSIFLDFILYLTDLKTTVALETSLHHDSSLTSSSSYDTCLLLSFRYFLNEDTIH